MTKVSSWRLSLLAQVRFWQVQARCGLITLTMPIPLRRGSCPSLARSVWQMHLADGYAESLADAASKANKCPVLQSGGTVEVYEALAM